MVFSVFVKLCIHHHIKILEHYYYPLKKNPHSIAITPPQLPHSSSPMQTPNYCLSLCACLSWRFHINGMHGPLLLVLSEFILVAVHVRVSVPFMAKWYFVFWTSHTLFIIHYLVDFRDFVCYRQGALMNNAAVNFRGPMFSFLLGIYLRLELLGHDNSP